MDANRYPTIEFGSESGDRAAADATVVEYVGGPRDGDRERSGDSPTELPSVGGTYRRSLRCADDGALRYVFEEDPIAIAHER